MHLVRQASVAKYTNKNGIRVYSIHELTMLDSLSFENIFFEKQRVWFPTLLFQLYEFVDNMRPEDKVIVFVGRKTTYVLHVTSDALVG